MLSHTTIILLPSCFPTTLVICACISRFQVFTETTNTKPRFHSNHPSSIALLISNSKSHSTLPTKSIFFHCSTFIAVLSMCIVYLGNVCCVCVYWYSVWAVSKSTVVKSLIIQLPTAVIIEDGCSVGPRLGRSKVNIYLED